jgi:CheY-like chemotaxis protein/HPt (histidine-containing phosphotransfer) domain-containing protein
MVELMGGQIGIVSAAGAGSTFWFEVELPIADKADTVPQATDLPVSRKSARILLAEDLPINQELACTILGRAGHQVDVANDGAEAVKKVKRKDYDLILMDIQMPKVDGMAATRMIRELGGGKGAIPIIAMTANVMPEQIKSFLQAGMNGHVAKPIKQEDLHRAIALALERPSEEAAGDLEDGEVKDFDQDIFGKIAGIFPPARLDAHLASFDEQLGTAFVEEGDTERLKNASHKLITQAGMLGFMRLSELCRDLEEACETGQPLDGALTNARAAAEDARAKIAELRSGIVDAAK